ncbi:MAG: hypothetical protein IT559_04685 [Alphaproteobacteria bacterium]|nr:hypothetical protein [Alphaproteobacteria bacterium]
MASFDFVECAARSYRFAWDERDEILRLSLVMLAFKVVSFMTVTALGFEDNLLRQGLILLPSQFLEGLVICKILVLAVMRGAKKNELPVMYGSFSSLRAAAIVYALIKLALSFLIGMAFLGQGEGVITASPPEGGSQTLILAVMLLILVGWSFRFLWLYVPVALGYGMGEFARRFKGFLSSVNMLGLWILCFTPLAMVLILFSEILGHIIPGAQGELPSVLYLQVLAVVQAVMDYVISLVASIGMAYGISSVLGGGNNKAPLF